MLIDVGDEVSCHVELLQVCCDTAELVRAQSNESVVGKSQRVDLVVSMSVERQLSDGRRVLCLAVDCHQSEDRRRRTVKCLRHRGGGVIDVGATSVETDSLSISLVIHAPVDGQQ